MKKALCGFAGHEKYLGLKCMTQARDLPLPKSNILDLMVSKPRTRGPGEA